MWDGRGIDWIMPGPSGLGKELRLYAREIYSNKIYHCFHFWVQCPLFVVHKIHSWQENGQNILE